MHLRDIERLVISLEKVNSNFIIKDFTGFLNWDSPIGAVLLPHTGHHSVFCQMLKKDPQAYQKCVVCSRASNRMCAKNKVPFVGECYLGMSEYTIPLVVKQECVGSLSVGSYCSDVQKAGQRLHKLASELGLDEEALGNAFDMCCHDVPTDNTKAVFHFFADVLSHYFEDLQHEGSKNVAGTVRFDSALERVLRYIALHYTDPGISMKGIAVACGYSESTISHIFNRQMKMNIRTYINHLRVVLAKKELQNGNSAVITAMICGFNDSNYFSAVFTSIVGIPPSQYAKNERQPM